MYNIHVRNRDEMEALARLSGRLECPIDLEIQTACPTPLEGKMEFEHTIIGFADQGLVTGSVVLLDYDGHRFLAEIAWEDWNIFRFKQVF